MFSASTHVWLVETPTHNCITDYGNEDEALCIANALTIESRPVELSDITKSVVVAVELFPM